MLRGDLDTAKKTIVKLRAENKEVLTLTRALAPTLTPILTLISQVKELKQQLIECREALPRLRPIAHAGMGRLWTRQWSESMPPNCGNTSIEGSFDFVSEGCC
jgi:hypothetical protein